MPLIIILEFYNMTISCAVTQNGQLCQSCTQCAPNENNTQTISFNCCNVQTDLKQTCGPVSNRGGAAARFDVIPPEEQGKCSGGTLRTLSVSVLWVALVLIGRYN